MIALRSHLRCSRRLVSKTYAYSYTSSSSSSIQRGTGQRHHCWNRALTTASFSSSSSTPTDKHNNNNNNEDDNGNNNNDKPVAIFLNATRLDYDGQLDFSKIEHWTNFVRNDVDYVTTENDIVDLIYESKAEIVIVKEMELPSRAIERFPPNNQVKLICEAGTGYNNIPIRQARSRDIIVCNVPAYSTDAVAQMAITSILNLSISMMDQQRMLWTNDRRNFTGPFTLPLTEVNGKTLGLIGGSGLIGSKVTDIALQLGMHIIISSRSGKLPSTHRHVNNSHVGVVQNVSDLLQHSDYVSIHCPLNDETRGSFGRTQIGQMKSTAFLINTSRGGICNEDEVVECLSDGMIAGAALDVTVDEPPRSGSKLWTLPNVTLTPHIGWRRIETRQRLVDMTAHNIEAYLTYTKQNMGNDPNLFLNVVN